MPDRPLDEASEERDMSLVLRPLYSRKAAPPVRPCMYCGKLVARTPRIHPACLLRAGLKQPSDAVFVAAVRACLGLTPTNTGGDGRRGARPWLHGVVPMRAFPIDEKATPSPRE